MLACAFCKRQPKSIVFPRAPSLGMAPGDPRETLTRAPATKPRRGDRFVGRDAAFTVSQSAVPKVAAYTENQKEHHRVQAFDDEYKAFLDRHDIEYDDRFVLG